MAPQTPRESVLCSEEETPLYGEKSMTSRDQQGIHSYPKLQTSCMVLDLAFGTPATNLLHDIENFWGRYLKSWASYISWIFPKICLCEFAPFTYSRAAFTPGTAGAGRTNWTWVATGTIFSRWPSWSWGTLEQWRTQISLSANSEILCEVFQVLLYDLAGVFSFFSFCLLRWPIKIYVCFYLYIN